MSSSLLRVPTARERRTELLRPRAGRSSLPLHPTGQGHVRAGLRFRAGKRAEPQLRSNWEAQLPHSSGSPSQKVGSYHSHGEGGTGRPRRVLPTTWAGDGDGRIHVIFLYKDKSQLIFIPVRLFSSCYSHAEVSLCAVTMSLSKQQSNRHSLRNS